MTRNCNNCNTQYEADERNVKRGWGLCCSKSCAAYMREKSKKGYNPERVARNNVRRVFWNGLGLDTPRTRRTPGEGYEIINGTAYDEFGEPVYDIDPNEDFILSGWDEHKH